MIGFSIIICCYNSRKRLPKTLKFLADLRIPDRLPIEVLVINNNSHDDTVLIAKMEWDKIKAPFPLHIYDEPKPGLTYARIKGIEKSNYDYLIFCDDDNWLSKDYLEIAQKYLKNEECQAVGGSGVAVSDVELPHWFISTDGYGYAIGSEGRIEGPNNTLYGAGLCLKRPAAERFLRKSTSLLLSDRKGNSLSSGGDIELCHIIGQKKIYYSTELKFFHFLEKHRLTKKYRRRLFWQFGVSDSLLVFYKLAKKPNNLNKRKIYLAILLEAIVWLLPFNFNRNKKKELRKVNYIISFVLHGLINYFKFNYLYSKAYKNIQ